jgi:hypothetical protein
VRKAARWPRHREEVAAPSHARSSYIILRDGERVAFTADGEPKVLAVLETLAPAMTLVEHRAQVEIKATAVAPSRSEV